jgi:hypothetical protein
MNNFVIIPYTVKPSVLNIKDPINPLAEEVSSGF